MRAWNLALLLALTGCVPDIAITKQPVDADGDGYLEDVDCDDAHATVNPDAAEVCDGLDNDCDDVVDDAAADAPTWYADADGDGAGDPEAATAACEAPDGAVSEGDDCDDAEPAAFPGNPEVCDAIDNDCDGAADEDTPADAGTWYADADGDGWGDPALAVVACDAPADHVALGTDCDDADPAVHPDAVEEDCTDPTDYNCDGSVGWADADGDGAAACEDCDDADAARSPTATEVCDEADADEDCSGAADDADPGVTGAPTWYRDVDGDGYGPDTAVTVTQCEAPTGYAAVAGDCDDHDALVSPAGAEVCDAADADEDCDGTSDDADASVDSATWTTLFRDGDGDGYGDPGRSLAQCEVVAGYVANATDCDDTDAARSPGAAEVCDAADADEDCDGLADDADSSATGGTPWYPDADADGFGGATGSVSACAAPAGYVATAADCDDRAAGVNPGAAEACDAADVDEDCDGLADDADPSATGKSTVYADADGDGYPGATAATYCDAPGGYGTSTTDCDDTRAAVSPAGTEVCATAYDDDCDGDADEAGTPDCTTWYLDADGDGHGVATSVCTCTASGAYTSTTADDCDDAALAVYPGASEVCDDGVDGDCDGTVDEDCDLTISGDHTLGDDPGDEIASAGGTTSYAGFGSGIVASDLDGDGDEDLLIAANAGRYGAYYGAVYRFDGPLSTSGLDPDTDADALIYGSTSSTAYWGAGLWELGDLDGDGVVEVTSIQRATSTQTFYVWEGEDITGVQPCTDGAWSFLDPGIRGRPYAAGDTDGDGLGEFVVGESDTSQALLYEGSTLVSTISDSSSTLGQQVAGGSDFDGDGLDDVVVGAPTQFRNGRAYVFFGPIGASVTPSAADVTITGAVVGDIFGYGTDALGDLTGDGTPDLIVGAPYSEPNGDQSGRAYLFDDVENAGSTSDASAVFEGQEDDMLGYYEWQMDGGDVDGDGAIDLLLAANNDDYGSISNSGGVWLFFGPIAGTYTADTDNDAAFYGDDAGDSCGSWLAMGDLDGNGVDEVIVSCLRGETGAVTDAGAVFVFSAE